MIHYEEALYQVYVPLPLPLHTPSHSVTFVCEWCTFYIHPVMLMLAATLSSSSCGDDLAFSKELRQDRSTTGPGRLGFQL